MLLLSSVRDEAALIERVARSVAAQTMRPTRWLVWDDGSSDGTAEILRQLHHDLPWLQVRSDGGDLRTNAQRLVDGAPARALNRLLATVPGNAYTHVAVLDGDIELEPDCLRKLVDAFRADPGLGIAGPELVEPAGERWRPLRAPEHHVHGGMRMYSWRAIEALRPLPELLGWDTIDQAYARMYGMHTRRLGHVVARHHRPCGAGDGALRGRVRYGAAAYVGGQPPAWMLLRAAKVSLSPPRAAGGLAFVAGYCGAALRRTDRAGDRRYRRFVRAELRNRLVPGRGTS